MSKPQFSHRLTVNVTPDMDRYLEELARTRTRQGKPVAKADLIREALRYYMDNQEDLSGSRRQIAHSLDSKLQAVIRAVDELRVQVNHFSFIQQEQQRANRNILDLHGQRLDQWRDGLRRFADELRAKKS